LHNSQNVGILNHSKNAQTLNLQSKNALEFLLWLNIRARMSAQQECSDIEPQYKNAWMLNYSKNARGLNHRENTLTLNHSKKAETLNDSENAWALNHSGA
jgi:hypothetical protein